MSEEYLAGNKYLAGQEYLAGRSTLALSVRTGTYLGGPKGGPMFTHKLDGDLLFARIYELDLCCPQCGETFYLNSVGRSQTQVPGRRKKFDPGPYNFRTGRFTCPSCHSTFGIGVYVFPIENKDGITDRHGEAPAIDWVPTYRQGLALRNQTTARVAMAPQGWRAARNTVVRDGCLCRIQGQSVGGRYLDGDGREVGGKPAKKPYRTRFYINPDCPIHGGLVDREIGEKTPAGVARSVPAGTEIVDLSSDRAASSDPPRPQGDDATSRDGSRGLRED
jgi:hypothetical protein